MISKKKIQTRRKKFDKTLKLNQKNNWSVYSSLYEVM